MTAGTGTRRRSKVPVAPGQLGTAAAVPGMGVVIFLVGGPLVLLVIFSFLTQPASGGGVTWQPTLTAYRDLLFDTDFLGRSSLNTAYLKVLARSLLMATASTAATLALAFPLALWIATRERHRHAALLLLVTIPFWTNLLVRTYAWILLLGHAGLVRQAFGVIGVEAPELLYTPLATMCGLVYTSLPFMVLPIYASLSRFDVRLAEAAYDLGAGRGQVLRRVIIPAARAGILSGLLLVFVPTLGAYIQPMMLGGGRDLLVGSLIANQFGSGRNWPLGSALSIALLLVVVVGLWLGSRRSFRHPVEGS